MDLILEANRNLQIYGADRTERRAILQAMLKSPTFESFSKQYPVMASSSAVKRLCEGIQLCRSRVVRLTAHAKRTAHTNLRNYMTLVGKLEEACLTKLTTPLLDLFTRHSLHCERIFGDLQRSRYIDGYAAVLLTRLHEELAKDAKEQIAMMGKMGVDHDASEMDDEMEGKHEAFVKAIKKAFGIEVHHWEPVREGLMVSLDQDNTKALLDQLLSYNDQLDLLTKEHGYILLQRGSTSDALWGGFGTPTSKWMFIHCPHDLDSWTDDSMEKLGQKRAKEAEKLDKKMIDEIDQLPV